MSHFYRGPTIPLDPAEAERQRRASAAMAELTRHPADHVGGTLKGADPERMALHRAAILYMRKVEAVGRKVSYAAAVKAVTLKGAAR